MVTVNSYNRQAANNTPSQGWNENGYYSSAKVTKEHELNSDHLIPNNPITKTKAGLHKLSNAFSVYPSKGLSGNENANFYEFLSMGTIPYIVGSVGLISVFNSASKNFMPASTKEAGKLGKKLGVGVAFYALGKALGQKSVNEPIRAVTGIDLDQPYVKVVSELPPNGTEKGKVRKEYHKVFESVDFPRWDLMYKEGNKVGNRNEYFDKLAERNGMGPFHSSDQEMKPKVKEMAIKAKTWKTIVGYLWAATAVGLAAQSPWEELFVNKGYKEKNVFKQTGNITKKFFNRLGRSFKEMWQGGVKKSKGAGIVGKTLLIASVAGSLVGTIASTSGFKSNPKQVKVINPNQRVYES